LKDLKDFKKIFQQKRESMKEKSFIFYFFLIEFGFIKSIYLIISMISILILNIIVKYYYKAKYFTFNNKQYERNITILDLSYNQISNISTLPILPNLTILNLNYNQISDISTLPILSNITKLYLGGNQISDISSLPVLPKLNILSLHDNQISDISTLPVLPKLNILSLDNNQISDISTLPVLPNLTILYLSGNQISDVSQLSNLIIASNLAELYVRNNPIINKILLLNRSKLRIFY
jgi:Leucine-rich repeat (LRR) protein